MAHDKIKAAARKRMAETGESYAAARREVIREFRVASSSDPAGEPERFAINYKDMGPISTWDDTRRGGGPAGGRIEVDADELPAPAGRLQGRRAASLRPPGRPVLVPDPGSDRRARQGRQVAGERRSRRSRGDRHRPALSHQAFPTTLFLRMKVNTLIVSLVDPDGFIAAVQHDQPWNASPAGS